MKRVFVFGFACVLLLGVFQLAGLDNPQKVAYDRGGDPLTIAIPVHEG